MSKTKVTTEQEPTKALTVPKLVTSAVANLPDYGADAGQGFEGLTGNDIVMPFIHVLQPLSKAVEKYAEQGARPGVLFNTVTEAITPGAEGVEFVPALVVHNFTEWVPRKQGGGFVGEHAVDSDIVLTAVKGSKKFGKYSTRYDTEKNPIGNDLVESYYVYGVAVYDGIPQPAVIVFTSAKIKAFKTLNTQIQLHSRGKIPLFAYSLRITSEKRENSEGIFYVFSIKGSNGALANSLLAPDDMRFTDAKGVRELVLSGRGKVDYNAGREGGADGGEGAGHEGGANPEKAPF